MSSSSDLMAGRTLEVPEHESADELALKYQERIRGKTIVITGASPQSLGGAFVRAVAKASPATVIGTGTSKARLQETINFARSGAGAAASSTAFHGVQVDLASQASIRKSAEEINSLVDKIDVLVLNAGVMATPWGLTEDGIEQQFGICHVGHFLLTKLLIGKVLAAGPGSRIVVVSSDGHRWQGINEDLTWENGKAYDKWRGYANAKTANALFALELARRLKERDMQSFSLQPGMILTGKVEGSRIVGGLGRHMTEDDLKMVGLMIEDGVVTFKDGGGSRKDLPHGAATHVYAAFDPDVAQHSGKYLRDCAVATEKVLPWAQDAEAAKKLWATSEELIGEKFDL